MHNIVYYKQKNLVRREPIIVDEVRNLIKKSFAGLKFVEESHQYFIYQNKEKIEYSSVSSITHKFQKDKDWDLIAKNYANKNKLDKIEVQKAWHLHKIISASKGSRVHNFSESLFWVYFGREDLILPQQKFQFQEGYLLPTCNKEEASWAFWEELDKKDHIFPVLSEAKVFSKSCSYSGTFDLLTYDSQKNGFIINDYKTNEDLFKEFKSPLLYPFQNYNDESFSLYILQLSLYQICLEEIGVPIIGRNLIHLLDNKTYKEYSLPDETYKLKEILGIKTETKKNLERVNFNQFKGFE